MTIPKIADIEKSMFVISLPLQTASEEQSKIN